MTLKQLVNKIVDDNNGNVFLNIKNACETLEVSTTTIYNYRSLGILNPIKRGRKVYFRVEDIAKIMRDGADVTGMNEHLKKMRNK